MLHIFINIHYLYMSINLSLCVCVYIYINCTYTGRSTEINPEIDTHTQMLTVIVYMLLAVVSLYM